jgi:arsenical pump membrane protein
VWAASGAVLLVSTGLLPFAWAMRAVGRGDDVYLFLTGMMLLSDAARAGGVFEWLAGHAARAAGGDTARLFSLMFAIGTLVTALLSNDATAVVLTPAVMAAARTADARACPLLFACALIANAASFLLPISNPANLVLYGGRLPALTRWLAAFALPSVFSIAATYLVLRRWFRADLAAPCNSPASIAPLRPEGWVALAGIAATATALLTVSAFDRPLGLPAAIAGAATAATVLSAQRRPPWALLRGVSWSILPLVAGMFVMVAALDRAGAVRVLEAGLRAPAWACGAAIAFAANLMNNLPAGLLASTAILQAHPPRRTVDALLIGVDLGPNLSVTGSLATILWLTAIRREGEEVGFWSFLKLGAVAMPAALALALAARLA